MKKSTLIIVILIAVLAIWYFFFRAPSSNTAALAVVPAGGNLQAGTALGGMAPNTNATATAPSQQLQPSAGTATGAPASLVPTAEAAIDPSQYDAIILNWMNGLGAANKLQALTIEPSMTPAEKAALADIISNVWTGNRAQTAADTTFWNAWRVKYHVLDGTYNPFANTNDTEQRAYSGVNNFRTKGSPVDAYGG